ncbi:MAG: dehydrogenase (quinone):NADPH-dependent reductase [Burkholderiaceae bacterium]|nr:dehydrogenase (quinone):NADPH-dependent reductase [Burkholderiaceae bacterium]
MTDTDSNQLKASTMNILQINSSARSSGSNSTRLASRIAERLTEKYPHATITVRDLASEPHPVLDEPALNALFTPAEQRTPEQTARVAQDDALIEQLQSVDALVLGVPMYNLGVPVQLKSWIDAIYRAGVTFRYGENGPEGLLTGKKVYVALARGGLYRDTPADSQVPYLKTALGFLGMTEIEFIYAEGLAMSGLADQVFEQAEKQIAELVV